MTEKNIALCFYKFVEIEGLEEMQDLLLKTSLKLGLKGKILIAHEGINGMLSGRRNSIDEFKIFLTSLREFANIEFKENIYDFDSHLFGRMLVKIKKYIITLRKEVDPINDTGKYLEPEDFLKLQEEGENFLIVDTRNSYEVKMGTFKGAIDPEIESFDEFPDWVDKTLSNEKDKQIVTFCTGGIRCEKATAYMKSAGFKNVYQIHGGILNYLEKTQGIKENYWEGDCVVFDKRKAVNKHLEPTKKMICYVCLSELNEKNIGTQDSKEGKACLNCEEKMSIAHKKRFNRGIERHKENLLKRALFLKEERKRYTKDSKIGNV